LGQEYLAKQVNTYMELFNIKKEDLQEDSYSDMLARKQV